MEVDVIFLDSPGVDVAVAITSAVTALPVAVDYLTIKNIGTGLAWVKGGNVATVATASAATSMAIPAGETKSYRIYNRTGGNSFTHLATIGAAVTTLAVYCSEGILR